MSTRIPLPPSGFDDLSAAEKIEYVESLWNRIATANEQVPVREWHRAVIQQRLEDREAAPDDAVGWRQFRDGLTRELRERNAES